MSRVLVAGLCPLPFEDALRNEGPGIRTWQFALGLARAGHHVHLLAWRIAEAYGSSRPPATETRDGVSIERVDEASFFDPRTMRRVIERLDPDALVGATVHGSYALARCGTSLPFWADQFGHTMAEAQAKAALDRDNAVLAYYGRRVEAVMRSADRVSVVSRRQRYAAIGELGILGRLSNETCGHDLVSVVPCAVVPGSGAEREASDRDATQAFTVLWSGGFNVWSDVDTLFRGLEAAMAKLTRLRFVATGAEIPGQDRLTYPRFSKLVASSPHRERFQLAGWVPSADLARHVAGADLGILAERRIYEGELGSKNRVLQWMAAGLAVAYNRVGDLGDVIHERQLGLTFEAGDAEGLAERLAWAAEHPAQLRQMAAAARQVVHREFSVEATTQPLAEWAAAPSSAPDTTLRRRVHGPGDHARLRSWLVGLAERVGVGHWMRRGRSTRADRSSTGSAAYLVAFLLVLPTLAWIARDRSVWPWDQAWYAWNSVDLHEAWRHGLDSWLRAMSEVLRWKPPAVVWIGQWFVPLARLLGSLEAALLLSVWLTHAAALVLVWKAVFVLCRRRDLALLAALVVGAAPVFIWLSTQYMAEAGQTLAVAWFVWILSQATGWSRRRIAGHLLGATAFAMLAKVSSPLFCLGPGALAAWHLSAPRQPSPSDPDRHKGTLPLVLGMVAALAALAWYAVNYHYALAHASVATSGSVAELYGRRDSFLGSLTFWLSAARLNFFLGWVGAAATLTAVGGGLRLLSRSTPRDRHFAMCASVSGFEIIAVLSVFSLASNRDPRYLCALLPYVGLALSWAASGIEPKWLIRLLLAALGAQWIQVHLATLGLVGSRPTGALFQQADPDRGRAAMVSAVVSRTCDAPKGARQVSLVGIDLPWFNGNSLTYVDAKLRVEAGLPHRCRYVSIGYKSVEEMRPWLESLDLDYWITLEPGSYPTQAAVDFLNRSSPALFGELQAARRLIPEPWNGPKGVRLFKIAARPIGTP